MTDAERTCKAAIAYADLGFLVLPLWSAHDGRCDCGRADCRIPGKHPHGLKDATRDKTVICSWFSDGQLVNIGIRTGPESGILVVDVDPRHGGNESLAALGELPTTATVETGGGGRHYDFKYPAGADIRNSAAKLGPGLDIRANGGYVVAPPSKHISGREYKWLIDPQGPGVQRWGVQPPAQRRQSSKPARSTGLGASHCRGVVYGDDTGRTSEYDVGRHRLRETHDQRFSEVGYEAHLGMADQGFRTPDASADQRGGGTPQDTASRPDEAAPLRLHFPIALPVHSGNSATREVDGGRRPLSGEQLQRGLPHALGAGRDRERRIPRSTADVPEPMARERPHGIRRDAACRPQRVFDHASVLLGRPARSARPGKGDNSGRNGCQFWHALGTRPYCWMIVVDGSGEKWLQ